MVHSQASGGGSKFGRAMFPLLLVLLPISAESAFVRCASGTCGSSTSFTQTNSIDEIPTPDQKLEFPFPLNGTFAGSGSSGLSLGIDEGSSEETEAGTEESSAQSSGVTSKKAPVAATQTEPQAHTQAPANSTPSFPQVGPTTTGERATRNYRTYETPAPRRIYDHPSAGGAGSTSSFPAPAPAAGGQSSGSSSSTPSSPAPPPPPPPPPPGQGSPGGFAPGQPGEVAGFIG